MNWMFINIPNLILNWLVSVIYNENKILTNFLKTTMLNFLNSFVRLLNIYVYN